MKSAKSLKLKDRLTTLLVAFFLFLLIGCTKVDNKPRLQTLERVQKDGTLHVGYVVYPPTVIKDPNTGDLSGHFVDAARFLAEVMNVKIQFHEADFSTFVAGLQSRQYDLSIAATYRTIPRAMAVAFTDPIIYIGNGVIVRKGDSRFGTLSDFNQEGITLAVAQGEASHEYAEEHFPKATLTVISTANLALPLTEVLTGRADTGMADAWTTSQFASEHSDVVVDLFAGRPYDLTPVGWAVRPDDIQWLNFVNTALDYMKSTGRMAEWEDQYGAHWVKPKIEYLAD